MLVDAINKMRINLAGYFSKMFKYQEELMTSNQQLLSTDGALRSKQDELENALKEKIVFASRGSSSSKE